MSIQFHCPSCDRAIEIDQQWAGRHVACPFCQTTVTAPETSNLRLTGSSTGAAGTSALPPLDDAGQPQATTDPRSAWAPPQPPYSAAGQPPAPSRNMVATVALVLSTLMLLCLLTAAGIMVTHAKEMIPDASAQQGRSFEDQMRIGQERGNEFAKENPSVAVALSISMFGGAGLWLAAMICACIGLANANQRSRAVIALVLCVAGPVLLCCGGVIIAGQAAAGA